MYRQKANGWLKHIDFILCDLISLLLAFCTAYCLRFDVQGEALTDLYQGYIAILLVVDFAVCVFFGTMHNVLKRGFYKEFAETVKHAVLVFSWQMILFVALKTTSRYSRIVMYATFGFHIAFGYAFRVLYKHLLRKRIVREKQRSVLLVSTKKHVGNTIRQLQEKANDLFRLAGVLLTDVETPEGDVAGIPVVETIDGAAKYICREWIDEVFIDTDAVSSCEKLIQQCREMGIVVHERLFMEHSEGQKQFVEKLAGYTVLTSAINYATPLQATIKRLMDIAGGLVGCLLAVIIIAIIGPKIKKESPGPILYAQERIGQNGKRFKFYKIRSMYLDADERKKELMSQNRVADGMMFKLDFDPRIIGNVILPDGTKKTGIGALIRNTSLDEFPQFFNVLKGDMSLVGTRPPTVDEWEKYELHHRARLAMKPGITGMWQVSGRSSITDFEEIVKLDTHYICNWSLGLDFKILFKTVWSVLHKEGAM